MSPLRKPSNQIAVLRSFQQYLPISLSGKQMTVDKVLQETLIQAHTTKRGRCCSLS